VLSKVAKMAGVQSRFLAANQNTIEAFKNSAKNQNTRKSTEFWVRVWGKWCLEKKIAQVAIENYEPHELNKLLESFYAEVKTQKGEDYEPECLKIMITALDRHLKDNGYQHSIVRDREFTSSKSVLEGKAKQLRQEGRGKRPNKSRQLTAEEEEMLWEKKRFGAETPEILIQTIWWLLTQHFGLRGRQEHHQMKMNDFRISRDDNGIEYVEFAEGPTKTRQSGLNTKQRSFQPRMFATGTDRCPVELFKEYVSRRPANMQYSGPFYLSV
jgi:hypothetical protein